MSSVILFTEGRINSDGVVGLTRAFLAAGAQCVLFCLWPVPEMAAKILLKTFYTALLKVNCFSKRSNAAILHLGQVIVGTVHL